MLCMYEMRLSIKSMLYIDIIATLFISLMCVVFFSMYIDSDKTTHKKVDKYHSCSYICYRNAHS